MRIHLGHHFYGAGNLGDDFMLAGFLGAMRSLAPEATFTCSVPFPIAPLQQRFPGITWLPYENPVRASSIGACDVWLGLGGSPFQSALSRWFVDHLISDAAHCARARKPMFYLGVGVQQAAELAVPEVRALVQQAAGIWTRDTESAERLRRVSGSPPIEAATDLAHVFFRACPPPPARPGRVTAVLNFDYNAWPGQNAFLAAIRAIQAREHVWLAQESRELTGAERALYAALLPSDRAAWKLVAPEHSDAPLPTVLAGWPSGEWLLTARYHAALAGAWAGSRVVVVATNEKLRAAARELTAPLVSPDANEATVREALHTAQPAEPPQLSAQRAFAACEAFVRSAVAHRS